MLLKNKHAIIYVLRVLLAADITNIALFLASDMASKITGVTIDATVGTTKGINYRTTELSE
jgi:hypothetical protein